MGVLLLAFWERCSKWEDSASSLLSWGQSPPGSRVLSGNPFASLDSFLFFLPLLFSLF